MSVVNVIPLGDFEGWLFEIEDAASIAETLKGRLDKVRSTEHDIFMQVPSKHSQSHSVFTTSAHLVS